MNRTVIVLSAALALAPAAAMAQAGPFLKAQGADLWTASKLVGVAVMGPDGKQVGTVTDVLMDHAGQAVDVVIGVGGFLGIGQKDVALPFAQVHFSDQPGPGAAANATAAGQEKSTFLSANGGMMGSGMMDGAAKPAQPGGTATTPPAPETAALGGPAGTTAGVAGGQATGLAATPAAPPGGTAAPDQTTARPGRASVDLTAAQLKEAPAFTFAR